MKTWKLMTMALLAGAAVGLSGAEKKMQTPAQVVTDYMAAASGLQFAKLKTLLTKMEYADEYSEEELELNAAKLRGDAFYQAKLAKEKAEEQMEFSGKKIVSEQINANKAVVTLSERDGSLEFVCLEKSGESWLISETGEDDRKDAERFLGAKILRNMPEENQHTDAVINKTPSEVYAAFLTALENEDRKTLAELMTEKEFGELKREILDVLAQPKKYGRKAVAEADAERIKILSYNSVLHKIQRKDSATLMVQDIRKDMEKIELIRLNGKWVISDL